MTEQINRCNWVSDDLLYIRYHDEEWGVPVHDDRLLFEFLILEGAQAGLSWSTILKKRENYREAFAGFDPEKVASFGSSEVEELLQNAGIVRNRLKVESAIRNARGVLDIQGDIGSLDAFLWKFVDGDPIQNNWKRLKDVPTETDKSRTMSKELKRRGFNFVGPTICYAFMQAVGMVNDHTVDCFRHAELGSGKGT